MPISFPVPIFWKKNQLEFSFAEEILMQSEAVWFSPDSRSIVYATFNDSEVGEIKFVDYGKTGDNYSIYPKTNAIRYPKV